MNVLLYATKHTKSGRRLKRCLETLASLESLIECWNLSELITCFQNPDPLPETVILLAATRQDFSAFATYRFRLEQVFFILVLPDSDTETIARGHQLRPRFIAYADSDFSEVGAVLDRLHTRRDNVSGGHSLPPA